MRINELAKAYRMAVRAADDPRYDNATRAVFRAIGYQIWKACGDGNFGHDDQHAVLVAAADKA